jgi:hypothetical protein
MRVIYLGNSLTGSCGLLKAVRRTAVAPAPESRPVFTRVG